jgi:hypothetical protein
MESAVIITEKDVLEVMDQFTRVPPLLLKIAINKNSNVVKTFESQILGHINQISEEQMLKINKVLEMPVTDLQDILKKAYMETPQKQLKMLADPKAEPFITKNLQELENIIFSSE